MQMMSLDAAVGTAAFALEVEAKVMIAVGGVLAVVVLFVIVIVNIDHDWVG